MKHKINSLIKNQQIFDEHDPLIFKAHQVALKICAQYNQSINQNNGYPEKLLRDLFNQCGTDLYIEPNFNCQFGFNISLGNEVFLNHDCTLQDFAPITIGDQANIAPRIGFYTASAPQQAKRKPHTLQAKPITLKDNVWIGGNASILGGVTIGNNAIIGAGSVVTKDVPDNAVVIGNPAHILRIL